MQYSNPQTTQYAPVLPPDLSAPPPPSYTAITQPYGQTGFGQTQSGFGQTQSAFGRTQPPARAPVFQPVPIITATNFQSYNTKCPHCRAQIHTETNYKVGLVTWVWCCLLGWLGLVLCCFIPFCMDSCKDVTHTCPSCHHEVATYKRSDNTAQTRTVAVHHY